MRILALRGSNLASLAGEFSVDFEADLGGQGLFAITGPTGSGKSTLLDALCLALFDSTPRLASQGGAKIGREEDEERLPAQDVRSLLRRGSSRGHAEVDFQGVDGGRYRARWEVGRARDRSDGRLRPQTLTLTDLSTGRPLGESRKTETLAEIERRLGLNFDQFRRSVLLAQGDFAAFLKARGAERAELLERMTGTEIYSRLSVAAHQRAGEEKSRLDALEAEAGAVQLLSDEERAGLEARLALEEEALEEARNAGTRARERCAWHARRAELVEAEGAAREALAGARQALEDAEPRRRELRDLQAAEPLRGAVARVDESALELEQAGTALAKATGEEELRTGEAAGAEKLREEAAERLRQAAEARQAATAEIAEARTLDGRLAQAEKALEEATRAAEAADLGARKAASEASGAEAGVREAEASRARASAWLESKAEIRDLVERWALWEHVLERFRKAEAERRRLEARRPELEERWIEAGREAEKARLRLEETGKALREADARRQAAEQAAAGVPTEALREERERLAALERQLQVRRQETRDGQQRRQEEQRLLAEAIHLEASAAGSDRAAAEGAARAEALGQRLAEARETLQRLHSTLDLEARRSALVAGAPCPLCGSTEHPYADGSAPGAALVQDQQVRVGALEEEHRSALKASEEAATLARAHREAAGKARSQAARFAAEAAGFEARARKLPEGDLEAVQARLAEVQAEEAKVSGLARAAREAREAWDGLRTRFESEGDGARRAEELARQRGEDHARVLRERDEASGQGDRAVEELAPAFGANTAWERTLRRDPEGFLALCRTRVEEWKGHEELAREAGRALAELAPRVATLRTAAEAAAVEATAREAQRRVALRDRDGLAAARRAKLSGRPADEVEAELQAAIGQVEARVREAALAAQGAQEALARARGHREAAGQRRDRAAEAHGTARLALQGALSTLEVDEGEVRRRLEHPPEWRRETEAALEALAGAAGRAETVLAERTLQCEVWQAGRPPGTREEAGADLAQAEQALQDLQAALARTRATLEQEARNREARQEVLARVETQRGVHQLWEGLRSVIGSGDGKKFRVFAQSLTLEALLAEANEHLRELARRYRLERVPPPKEGRASDDHLEIQVVDLDMGDAVRSVQSLSGGESFLVSLALALGLSALAAERTRIESLFIDEGFGTLDADTLETALACLESLQAGGRQVGLISHVPGMAERLGAQVRVEGQGRGRSRVVVQAPGGAERA